MSLNTVALELVPSNVERGRDYAVEEARKVLRFATEFGLADRIRHVMIPGMIEEDEGRPVEMKPKLDVLDYWSVIRPELPGVRGLCTQVTAFTDEPALRQRLGALLAADFDGIVFVGVPRTMADGEGTGVAPTDALALFGDQVANRGAVLIPTREGEQGRFGFKCERGATFALTQLLYSDAIVGFLREFARTTEHRPEILLSFGFVPAVESKVGLINWLIQDPGNPVVAEEQAFVRTLAATDPEGRRKLMLDLYKRVIDGVVDLGFPLSIHLEATYGPTRAAFETFAELLAYWAPSAS
ncbi:mycobacterial-type methylenetetrahydrofolate reductase [uncultured Mycolicibacterium sp.]|uniref:mycobacterial-type methylenetetrahydrofolate reductase n=1 Tax=uncultured Mycolicibacterium sp. TaxID=2320817 RepID=UPI0026222B72|nr:mycobacterial-type methylenetetrahydrofolate reductase [uncultured Mycolicibacterium sp.]